MQPSTLVIEIPQARSMPATAMAYPPPPISYRGNRQVTIMFKTSPEVLANLVPAPLQPNPDQLMAFYSALMHVTAPMEWTYKEVGLLVPVSYNGRPGNYFVCLYLDTVEGILAGREIWGFPKQQAEITYAEAEGGVTTSGERMGFPLFKASMRLEMQMTEIPPSPPGPFFNLKIIPSVRKDAPPAVLQLTSTEFVPQTTELYTGPATFEIGNLPFGPAGDIPILGIAAARFTVYDAVLDYGEVLVDYRALY